MSIVEQTIKNYIKLTEAEKNGVIQRFFEDTRIINIYGKNLEQLRSLLANNNAYQPGMEGVRDILITAQIGNLITYVPKNILTRETTEDIYSILQETINNVSLKPMPPSQNFMAEENPTYHPPSYGGRRRKTRKTRRGKTRKHRGRTSSR